MKIQFRFLVLRYQLYYTFELRVNSPLLVSRGSSGKVKGPGSDVRSSDGCYNETYSSLYKVL